MMLKNAFNAAGLRRSRDAREPTSTGGGADLLPRPLPIQDGQVIPLWTGPSPGALGSDDTDTPVITVSLPRTVAPNTPAAVICPGGSYRALAPHHEGRQVASYLNSLG